MHFEAQPTHVRKKYKRLSKFATKMTLQYFSGLDMLYNEHWPNLVLNAFCTQYIPYIKMWAIYVFFQNIVPLDWCGFWPANDLDRSPNFVSSMTNQNGGDHPINQNGNGGALTSSVENIRTTSMERQSVLARSALEKGTFKAPPEWREYVAGGAAQGFNICITFPIHKTMFRWGHSTCKDLCLICGV